ncbi:MAG: DUF4258 domain-containing protein [Candidatus Woesearchaeota archaeon]
MNCKDELITLLKPFRREQIIITPHAHIRMIQRQISENEVIENILNPKRLVYAIRKEKQKFDCYFDYSKNLCHRYILAIEKNIVIITVVKINRRWQHIVEKKILLRK